MVHTMAFTEKPWFSAVQKCLWYPALHYGNNIDSIIEYKHVTITKYVGFNGDIILTQF